MPRKSFRVGRSKTGLGLFAVAEIPKGTLIAYYRGRRITTEYANSSESGDARYMFELNSRWTIDGSSRKNIARYANHSCRPNAESEIKRGKIFLQSIKRIQPGDEITYDYGKEYFDMFIKPKGCRCVKCTEKRREERKAKRLAKKRAESRAKNRTEKATKKAARPATIAKKRRSAANSKRSK